MDPQWRYDGLFASSYRWRVPRVYSVQGWLTSADQRVLANWKGMQQSISYKHQLAI